MRFDHTIFEAWEWLAIAVLAVGIVVGTIADIPVLVATAGAGVCFLALRAQLRRGKR